VTAEQKIVQKAAALEHALLQTLPGPLRQPLGAASEMARGALGQAARVPLGLLRRAVGGAPQHEPPDRRPPAPSPEARAVAADVRRTVERVGAAPPATGDPVLPIDDYDRLLAQEVLPKLRLLTMPELARIEEHERAGRARKQVLARIAKLRTTTTTASQPAPR
jgi:hypothetical protein